MAVNERILSRILNGSLDVRKHAHRRLIEAAQHAAARLRRMLADLNAILDGRAPDVRLVPLELRRVVDNLVQEFLPLAESEGIELVWHCDAEHHFSGDADLLHRILENYLYNGLNHTGYKGRVSVWAAATSENEVVFRVENTGSTIPEDQLEQIFEAGVQLNLRADRTWRGHGLGLAFCQLAANALGGRVWAENLPDARGVAFCLQMS